MHQTIGLTDHGMMGLSGYGKTDIG